MRHLVLLVPFLASACGTDCTAQIVMSVVVEVLTNDGRPPEGLAATYTVDGGPEQPCEVHDLRELYCGADEAGRIVVRVTADEYLPAELVVDVAMADECHVEPEQRRVTLEVDAPGADG